MKKILLTMAVATMAVSGALAQGTIYALNGAGLLISTNVPGGDFGVTQGNGYAFALLIDSSTPTSSDPLTGGWTFSGVMLTNLINGVIDGGANTTVNGWTVNTFINYEIVGWSTDGGVYTTWAQVAAVLAGSGLPYDMFYGVSAEGDAEPGGGSPALGVWHLFGTTPFPEGTPIGGFTLAVEIPEPGVFALATLGGVSLLLFRRRVTGGRAKC